MFLVLTAFALVTMVVCPTAPLSRFLHRLVVEPCARWLNGLRWINLALAGGIVAAGLIMTLLFGAEGLRLYGMVATEGMVWVGMFDLTILIDLFVVGAAMTAMARVKVVRDQALMRLQSVVTTVLRAGRRRARRFRPTSVAKPRRTDDPDPFGLAYA